MAGRVRTFIFSYILERKREARVFSLDDAHLSECALAHDAQQTKVVEVHWGEIGQSRLFYKLRTGVGCSAGVRLAAVEMDSVDVPEAGEPALFGCVLPVRVGLGVWGSRIGRGGLIWP